MEVIIKGKPPKDPRQRVLAIEAALKAICMEADEDPADGVMVLLTAAAHITAKYTTKPIPETINLLAECLGKAIVVADDFFTLTAVPEQAS